MNKQKIDSIKKMELKSLEIIFNTAREIQSELDFTKGKKVFFTLNTFSLNCGIREKGLKWLLSTGAVKIVSKSAEGDITLGYSLIANEETILLVIDQIKKRMHEIAKSMSPENKVKLKQARLVTRGKYDIIILYNEEILATETGGVPASLMRILFKNINGQYRDIDYILANTKFSDRKQIWDTIKEFRKRLKKGKIKSGVRKQGYLLLLPT